MSTIRHMLRLAATAAMALALCPGAAARQPDGTLGLIQQPNNGMPALVLPGERFDAVLLEQAALSLSDGETAYPLEAVWRPLPGGRMQASCQTPRALPAGHYALRASTAQRHDENPRAVYVLESFPERYVVAHVSDTHIGKDKRHPRPSEAILRDVFQSVNASEASLVLVTGDLTEHGEAAEFNTFITVLDTCTRPTFVCPGNHGRPGLNHERFFGSRAYMFRFGQDGYLSFDTKDLVTADELGAQDADLERFRRALRPSRWSIGFTHRYEPMMGMRSQLVLFVDNPLDYLLFGHWRRENTPEEQIAPWGMTRVTAGPAAIDGRIRFIDVAPEGILPREPVKAAETR